MKLLGSIVKNKLFNCIFDFIWLIVNLFLIIWIYFQTDATSNAMCGSSFLDVYALDDFENGTFNPLMGNSNVNGFTTTDATAFVMKAFQFAETTDQEFTLVSFKWFLFKSKFY